MSIQNPRENYSYDSWSAIESYSVSPSQASGLLNTCSGGKTLFSYEEFVAAAQHLSQTYPDSAPMSPQGG